MTSIPVVREEIFYQDPEFVRGPGDLIKFMIGGQQKCAPPPQVLSAEQGLSHHGPNDK